jgi:hypothetical protein
MPGRLWHWFSLFGGLALANARLGAVHGMANPIGGMSHSPHGAVCARLLPLVMETNLHALHTRLPDSPAIARYVEVACLVTGRETAKAEDGIAWVREQCQSLHIRPLAEYGLKPEDYPALVEQSQKASSMKGNPVALTNAELTTILMKAACGKNMPDRDDENPPSQILPMWDFHLTNSGISNHLFPCGVFPLREFRTVFQVLPIPIQLSQPRTVC